MGRQSIPHNKFIKVKVDLNKRLELIFICYDGRNRLFRAHKELKIEKLFHELSLYLDTDEQDLVFAHNGIRITSTKADGSLTKISDFKLSDNAVIHVHKSEL